MSFHFHSLSDRNILRSTTPVQGHASSSEKKPKKLKSSGLLSKWMKSTLQQSEGLNLASSSKPVKTSTTSREGKTGKSLAKYKDLLSDCNFISTKRQSSNSKFINSKSNASAKNNSDISKNPSTRANQPKDDFKSSRNNDSIPLKMQMKRKRVSDFIKKMSSSVVQKTDSGILHQGEFPNNKESFSGNQMKKFYGEIERELFGFLKKIREIDLNEHFSDSVEEMLRILDKFARKIPEIKSILNPISKIIHLFHETSIEEVKNLVKNINEQSEYISNLSNLEEENKYLLAKISQMGKEVDLIKDFNKFTSVSTDGLNIKNILKENRGLRRELMETQFRLQDNSKKEFRLMKFYSRIRDLGFDVDSLYEQEFGDSPQFTHPKTNTKTNKKTLVSSSSHNVKSQPTLHNSKLKKIIQAQFPDYHSKGGKGEKQRNSSSIKSRSKRKAYKKSRSSSWMASYT